MRIKPGRAPERAFTKHPNEPQLRPKKPELKEKSLNRKNQDLACRGADDAESEIFYESHNLKSLWFFSSPHHARSFHPSGKKH